VIVHQLLCGAGPVDAVTNQALAWRRVFDRWGWGGEDFAEVRAPGMEGLAVKDLKQYEPGERTLVHYSGFAAQLEKRVGSPFMVLSHNITPPRYFWELEPGEAVNCFLAPAQLERLAARASVVAGVSTYNLEGLGGSVVPILFDRDPLPDPHPPTPPPDGPPTILFVGRLAPHKRQDLVVRAFGLYRRRHAPDARLVLVGVPISPDFDARLRRLADEVAPGAVTFANGIPAAELHEHYRSAHAFLCLSEHEGFCIPLLEAMHFGVPVIARAVGGIPEVLGDAGVLLDPADDITVVAELLALAPQLRDTVRERGEARLDHYAAPRVEALMRDHLERL
jgi:glycosyltransferase involved in cell wall biosynthesis